MVALIAKPEIISTFNFRNTSSPLSAEICHDVF
jgi:hypothetical protein